MRPLRLLSIAGAIVLLAVASGCNDESAAKRRLRKYLDRNEFVAMESRLDASDDDYVLLAIDKKPELQQVVVYWFGEDVSLPGLRILMEDGGSIDYWLTDSDRLVNTMMLDQGEPQAATISLPSEDEVSRIIDVELIEEDRE